MEAIEFISTIKNGKINIPDQYIDTLTQPVRVIILIEPQQTSKKKKDTKKDRFTAFKTKTKGLKFDRDEANKR